MRPHVTRFTRYKLYLYIETIKNDLKIHDPEKEMIVSPVLCQIQAYIEKARAARPFRDQQCSLAIKNRSRLDDGLLNFGFRRLPIADPLVIDSPKGAFMKTNSKYAGEPGKKKPPVKKDITRKEYRRFTAANVDKSLDKLFKTGG